MKPLSLLLVFLISSTSLAQENPDYYELGGKFANEGNYEKAIEYFMLELEREPNNYYAWYNMALCQSRLGKHKVSIENFNEAIELNPDYYKAYLSRAISKRNLTNYEGAIGDLNKCLEIKENYSWAYFHRGIINEYLKNYELACTDLTKAKDLGAEGAEKMTEIVCSTERKSNYANIIALEKNAPDSTYGYSADNPIMVGAGLRGGPNNQRSFLNLLRDPQGNAISYTRSGSCCEYKSENGFFGMGTLDIYEIFYLNEDGKETKTKFYISFYDYDEPMIPQGFRSIEP